MKILISLLLLVLLGCKTERATVTAIDGKDGVNGIVIENNNSVIILSVNQCFAIGNGVYAQNEGDHVNIYDNNWCLDTGGYYSICTDLYHDDVCECGDHIFRVDWEGRRIWID